MTLRTDAAGMTDMGWRLVLPDGAEVPIGRPSLVGREPVAPAWVAERGIQPTRVVIDDPERTVSKTHALLWPTQDGRGLHVRDLHSTNGTTFRLPIGTAPVPEDRALVVGMPAALELGLYVLKVLPDDRV